MMVLEAIQSRKSIRGYKPDPVPRKILEEILEAATRAPSTMNTQPWEFLVISGDVIRKISDENVRKLKSGAIIKPDHMITGWPNDSVFRNRQIEIAKQIFQFMGIPRGDKEKRAWWMERGFRFFDAPAAIILLLDRSLTDAGPLMDVGAVMQNICLAALHYGLGTCIEDQGVMYPESIREITGIPDTKRIVISVAIGYPDWEFPANKVISHREPVKNITTWCGFDKE
ncbi:MAG TPA: nitroreductase [Deltaproteobacteria bacterium]|nr:nitroreductase [Deltaproteobacteria bacterium]